MRIFMVCPANFATGGTELIHQFSQSLTTLGIENYIIYPDADGIHCPTPASFMKYGAKYVTKYVDSADSVLVLTETQMHLVNECKKGTAMIWWLSVDNYVNSYRERMTEEDMDPFKLAGRTNAVHFVQSHYAKDFVENGLGIGKTYFLKDYINDDIVKVAQLYGVGSVRKDICVYNPKKGYGALKPIMDACRSDIEWVALQGMKPDEMARTMCQAKVYVDFGNHPGKDRIPREAAVCGCCVLTNRKGSAAYQEDVTIPVEYRLEDVQNVDVVLDKIYQLVDNFDEKTKLYEGYRNKILGEKNEFLLDVDTSVDILKECVEQKEQQVLEPGRYDSVNQSLVEVTRRMHQLSEELKQACGERDRSHAMNTLYEMDFMMQIIRESIYAELVDMSEE